MNSSGEVERTTNINPPDPLDDTPCYPKLTVVGIGASAGGLEALERLFEHMPTDTGLAFVVVQHLSPDFKSLTDDILGRRTNIPIYRVENGMAVQPDALFLIPPRKDMIISGGKLLLTDKDPGQGVSLPIDHFFRSLAQDRGSLAIAVVLSGTGSDGSRGIRDIRAAGGLVIAQTPETAKFDGMPRSAMETGSVDLHLAPEEIPDALLRHVRHPRAKPEPHRPDTDVYSNGGLSTILTLLRDNHGIDFTLYRPDTVTRRIDRRLAMGEFKSIEDYAQRLTIDPAELNHLYKDLLIGVTRFFRDPDAFARLRSDVIPTLLDRLHRGEEFRAWVAGCATGEEAYSLAILIRECLDELGKNIPVKIFATDAHRLSLDTAGVGCYGESVLTDVSPERQERWFARTAAGWQILPEIRKLVVFAQHNVLKDAPFTKLDLVTCRNLLIYFQPVAQKKALTLFHFALKTGCCLFLGPSETTGEVTDEFDPIDPRWKIYTKRRDIRLPTDLRLIPSPGGSVSRPLGLPLPSSHLPDPQLLGSYDALLEEFMPPALLISETREVIQSFNGASRFLRLRDGRISTDLLDMVEPELRMALTAAIPRAFNEQLTVAYRNLRHVTPEGEKMLDIVVRPVRNRRGGVAHVVVLLQQHAEAPSPQTPVREIDLDQASREHILTLESELRQTRENLQAMIEELETSNEELQATNEELVAANEELQSTNEELHSVNEELHTVNAEYQRKITELTDLTADMDNLLASTEVHTIFLDRELRIRKFTPKIAESFNLLSQDIGRRIDNFTYSIDHPELLDDLRSVLEKPTALERQVRDRRGHWFLLRILPYRAGLAVDGVVLTLIELDQVKQAEEEARRKDEQLAAILRNSPNWVFLKDARGHFLVTDESFKAAVSCDPVGKTAHDLFPREVADEMRRTDEEVLRKGVELQTEITIPQTDGPHTYLSIKFPLRDASGLIVGLGGIKTDVTTLKVAEQMAQEAVHQRDRFLAILSHELRNPLAAILNAVQMMEKSGLEPSADQWFHIIERRARHMARLLDDLLDVARLAQNKIDIRKQPFDLTATVPEVLEEVTAWFGERQLILHNYVSTEKLPVEGDPARLHQIQVNLLMNAARYTPPGGEVWYTLDRDGNSARIRVRDTGIGLPQEMLRKIFDLFVQADRKSDRPGGGIGVGLTLVRAVVELHGGSVEAFSDGPGLGCEFIVHLPLARASLHADVDETRVADSPRLSILVVEDDPDIRQGMCSLLELEGHRVQTAANAEDALQVLTQGCPAIALIDIGLPGMNGYDLAREIRNAHPHSRMHLIALTGYGQQGDREAAFAAGFNTHLTKPFNPQELARVFAEVLPQNKSSQ